MTRAKNNLYIHCNNSIFDKFNISDAEYICDNNQYQEVEEIILQLSYADVYLGYFKTRDTPIYSLRSGDELLVDGEYMYSMKGNNRIRILKLSKKCMENLEEFSIKGYTVTKAEVRFVVIWKDKNDDSENAVVLPNISLCKII